jgi:hypothetical protein
VAKQNGAATYDHRVKFSTIVTPQTTSKIVVDYARNYKPPAIEKYDGDRTKPHKLRTFVFQIGQAFRSTASQFPDESSKINFITIHLKDAAFNWAQGFTKFTLKNFNDPSFLFTFDDGSLFEPFPNAVEYIRALITEFKDENWSFNCFKELQEIKQGDKETSLEFISRFETIASECDINESTKLNLFRMALNTFTSGLAQISTELSADYKAWHDAALKADLIRARKGVQSVISAVTKDSPNSKKAKENSSTFNTTKSSTSTNTNEQPTKVQAKEVEPLPDPDAMEIDAIKKINAKTFNKYSVKGKKKIIAKRREFNLCAYCGSNEHTTHPDKPNPTDKKPKN